MNSKLLFIGLATDGPTNTPILFADERSVLRTFGGIWTQRETLSTTASSLTLDFEPYIAPTNVIDSKLQYLYSPAVTGTTMYFGTVGGTATHTADIAYIPYLGQSDLIYALRKYLLSAGQIYGMRLGGAKAYASFANWTIESRFAGTKYNSVSCSLSSTGLLITGLEPNYATLTYSFASSGAWKTQFQRDYDLGISPIWVQTIGNTSSPFTVTLSGGTNGSFTESELSTLFDSVTLPHDISHICILTPATSGIIENIYDQLWDGGVQPRFYILPAPVFTAPASSWATTMGTTLPFRHNMAGIVVGSTYTTLAGRTATRYAAEGAAIGLFKAGSFNLTNTPVDAIGFTPVLTEAELDSLKNSGFMCLMRYIRNDISVYEGTTSSTEQSFLYSSKVAEIFSTTYKFLSPLIGGPIANGEQPRLSEELHRRLSSISFLTVDSVEMLAYGGNLNVKIVAALPNEILSIQFTIKNRPNSLT